MATPIAAALLDRCGAWHRLSWSGPWQLIDSSGHELDPAPLVEAALANPAKTVTLEHWLHAHGVPYDYRAEPPPPRPDPTAGPPRVYGGISGLGWTAATFLFVLNVGLLLKKIDRHDRWTHALHAFSNPGRAMLSKLLERPAEDLLHHPKSTLLPWPQIHSMVISQHGGNRQEIIVTLVDGTTRRLRSSSETDIQGRPIEALTHILGDRFTLLNEQQALQPADRSR